MAFNPHSLYNETIIDNNQRGYYNPINIKTDSSDMYIIISTEYHQKPGALAQLLYGDPRLSWIFMYFNRDSISDIIFDFKSGLIIRVPTKERLLSYF